MLNRRREGGSAKKNLKVNNKPQYLWFSFLISVCCNVTKVQGYKVTPIHTHCVCRYFIPSNHFDLSLSILPFILTFNQFSTNSSLSEIIKLRITYKKTPSIILKRPTVHLSHHADHFWTLKKKKFSHHFSLQTLLHQKISKK